MMKFRIVLLLITTGLLVATANAASPRNTELVVNGGFEADIVADGTWLEAVPSGWYRGQYEGTKGAIWNPTGAGTGAADFPYTGVSGNVAMAGTKDAGYCKSLIQMWDVDLNVGETIVLEADAGFAITDPPFGADSGSLGAHIYVIRDVTYVDTSRVNGSWSNETSPVFQTMYRVAGEYSWSAGSILPQPGSDGSMIHFKYTYDILLNDPITLWGGTALPNKAGLDVSILMLGYGDTAFDNVSVKIIPEPATLSLLALGLGFVIRRKR
jgi:hypothetical protein